MTGNERDAQSDVACIAGVIRQAARDQSRLGEPFIGDWKPDAAVAALARLVAALSAAERVASENVTAYLEEVNRASAAELRAEALAAQLQQAREALAQARSDIIDIIGAGFDSTRLGLARAATRRIDAALAAAAPATTLNEPVEYEADGDGRFYARYANSEVLPTGQVIRAFAGKSHITPKRYAEIIPAAAAAPNETEQT